MRSRRRITLPPADAVLDAGAGHHVLVYVRPTVRSFRVLVRSVEGRPAPKGLVGCCYGISGPVSSTDTRRCTAAVFLVRKLLGAGYVAHELAHAAFRIVQARKLYISRPHGGWAVRKRSAEEQYCLTLERLCAGFWSAHYASE